MRTIILTGLIILGVCRAAAASEEDDKLYAFGNQYWTGYYVKVGNNTFLNSISFGLFMMNWSGNTCLTYDDDYDPWARIAYDKVGIRDGRCYFKPLYLGISGWVDAKLLAAKYPDQFKHESALKDLAQRRIFTRGQARNYNFALVSNEAPVYSDVGSLNSALRCLEISKDKELLAKGLEVEFHGNFYPSMSDIVFTGEVIDDYKEQPEEAPLMEGDSAEKVFFDIKSDEPFSEKDYGRPVIDKASRKLVGKLVGGWLDQGRYIRRVISMYHIYQNLKRSGQPVDDYFNCTGTAN